MHIDQHTHSLSQTPWNWKNTDMTGSWFLVLIVQFSSLHPAFSHKIEIKPTEPRDVQITCESCQTKPSTAQITALSRWHNPVSCSKILIYGSKLENKKNPQKYTQIVNTMVWEISHRSHSPRLMSASHNGDAWNVTLSMKRVKNSTEAAQHLKIDSSIL